MSDGERFYGKYRGTVEANLDETGQGRLKVSCPVVLGKGRSSWAMPCVPYAAKQKGLQLIPPTKAHVWVEFEGGDPDYPIWSGCFWGVGEAPTQLEAQKVLATDALTLEVTDTGSVQLKIAIGGATVTVDGQGVSVDGGSGDVTIKGTKVDINDGAVEVS